MTLIKTAKLSTLACTTLWRCVWVLSLSLSLSLSLGVAGLAQARELSVGFVSQSNDPRYTGAQLEKAYTTAPGGRSQAALSLALDDAAFNLQAAGITRSRVLAKEAVDAAAVPAALQALLQAGVQHIVLELPATSVGLAVQALKAHKLATSTALTTSVKTPTTLYNAAAPEDALRGADCAPFLLHTLPSHAMQMDALMQLLAVRKWSKPLVLHGSLAEDAPLLAAYTRSAKRFGIKAAAIKPFKLSNDPRERDAGNVRLLTAGADHDAIVVLDSHGEFARDLPYRSVLARPVLGSAGLVATAWAAGYERNGAPQLNRRFAKRTGRAMTGADWAAWAAGRAIVEAVMSNAGTSNAGTTNAGKNNASKDPRQAVIDGYKGQPLSFRAWDGQLRQPLLLAHSNGMAVADIAPMEGFLHTQNTLDTLGFDQPESACKP